MSALNHALHYAGDKITLRSTLKNGGISNPDEAAPIEMASIDKVTGAMSDLYNKAKRPDFEIVEQIGTNKSTLGRSSASFNIDGTLVAVNPIKIAHRTFRSWMQLGSTVGHELIHHIDYHGNYGNWLVRYKKEGATARSEINAHRWQIQMSAPVNMTRYNSYLNKVFVGSNLKPYGIN